MFEKFYQPLHTKVRLDSQRVPRDLIHERHFVSDARTARHAAQDYLGKFRHLIGTKAEEFNSLNRRPERDVTDAGVEYRFHAEKPQSGTTTVAYYQTVFGLPVWEAGLAVHMKHKPFRIIGAQTTRHPDIRIKKPSARALARLKKLNATQLAELLGIAGGKTAFEAKPLRILRRRLMIYRYEKSDRVLRPQRGSGKTHKGPAFDQPTLPLPPVKRSIADGHHYVVAAIDFRTVSTSSEPLHWVALIEAETLSVLYLRALVDHACGLVFKADPMTLSGGPASSAKNKALNRLRSSVDLQGLHAPRGGKHSLTGNNVKIRDFEAPTAAPPVEPARSDFNYPARTNDFAAVNAYYNCDRFFRLVKDLGFPRASYFKATKFPVPVDHRGHIDTPDGMEINARCNGNTTADGGVLNVRFALADLKNKKAPLGLACDWRVVLHELGGHGTMWNHINYGLFHFAHSVGDSLAAILNDPDSLVRDKARFVTFPWIPFLKRRHDRKVTQGWAWGGTKDLGVNEKRALDPKGYQSEQILSTTHFRIYRAIGGDSVQPNMRHFAARFASYLILRTVGSFTPAHAPDHAAAYAAALMMADAGDWTSEGQPGGAYAKVIRWAFEKQGLYQPQPHKTPVKKKGAPPPVDVYIEDGRHGEYQYQDKYWNCRAIWNRHAADGGTRHQQPVAGATNFAYVEIKNRGTTTAMGVTVKAFHHKPSAGGSYPDDWMPMTTAELPAADVPPNSEGEVIVGPFEWEPSGTSHECMIMVVTAPGDVSNIIHFDRGKSIPEWRLVPHDNNIGLRSVFPVDGSGSEALRAAFDGLRLHVKNPHRARARLVVKPTLPPLLVKHGWQLKFTDRGGGAFSLKSRAGRDVAMRLRAGKKLAPRQLAKAIKSSIHVEVFADDILVGGASYMLAPKAQAQS
jgi:zinc metalloprotease ZmpB